MKTKKNAFSLIELLVVMVIIGILSGIGIASFKGNINKAKIAKNEAECAQFERCETLKKNCELNGGTTEECAKECDNSNICLAFTKFEGSNADHVDIQVPDLINSTISMKIMLIEDELDARILTQSSSSGSAGGTLSIRGNRLAFYPNNASIEFLSDTLPKNQIHKISVTYSPTGVTATINGEVQPKTTRLPAIPTTPNYSIGKRTWGIYGSEFQGRIYSFKINGKEKIVPNVYE